MNRLLQHNSSIWPIYLTAIICSLMLSAWIDLREVIINADGICYLQSARTIGTQGLQAAIDLCDQSKWPLYAMVIYGLVAITKFSYTTAAFVINGVFSALTVSFFITIVRQLGGTRRVLWFALIVILLAHEFNSTRQYIIRDHGFWAFYLWSILLLLCYFRQYQVKYALAFGVTSFIALLFRVEGTLLFLLVPFVALTDTRLKPFKRIEKYLVLNIVTILLGIVIACWFWLHPHKTVHHLGRLQEVQFQILHGLNLVSEGFHNRTKWLGQYVLLSGGARDATVIFIVVLFAGYIFNVIMNVSLIYSALIGYAWWKKLLRAEAIFRRVLWAYVIINTTITAAFYVENLYLSKRYLIALILALMLWIPFALDDLFQRFRLYFSIRKIYWLFPAVMTGIVLMSLGGIFSFGYSKAYLRSAGDWLAQSVPDQAKLYCNDYELMYYSRHFGNQIFPLYKQYIDPNYVLGGKWKRYDYVAIRYDKKDAENPDYPSVVREIKVLPVAKFANKRGDQVLIYKITA